MPEHPAWIPLADGERLAATVYRPGGAGAAPALLEALPYRKDDATLSDAGWYRRLRDEGGFAVCRVDVRGTGSSTGVAVDEYPATETEDLAQVIGWLAGQPWCSGRVGMFGTSYSGFNALHAARLGPPRLGAVCAIFASDDRYTDDVHYGGGVPRALDLLDYPLYMVALNALPPVPSLVGPDWRRAWAERVDRLEPWLLRWLAEPHDGPYWRRGSIRPGTDRIHCPTLLIAGWADGYHNATFRVFEQLRGPRRLLIGPWAHMSPEHSRPGPRADVVPELIRWFDRHLRERDGGDRAEPPITVFVREATQPAPDLDRVRGRFRDEPRWPPERMTERVLRSEDAIGPVAPAADGALRLPFRGEVGVTSSIWCAGALPFGQPWDQADDEVLGLVWDWPVGPQPLEVLGMPRLLLRLRSSDRVATCVAKLADVFPDGTSALVARGVQTLALPPAPLAPAPGDARPAAVELDATSWVFPPGHRIRLALAAGDWPSIWPPPRRGWLEVDPASLRLHLPVLDGPGPEAAAPALALPPPAAAAASPSPRVVWRVEDDRLRRERRVVIDHGGSTVLPGRGWLRERYLGRVGVSLDDPGHAVASGSASYVVRFPEATCAARADLDVRSDGDGLAVRLRLRVAERGGLARERRWARRYPGRLQ